MKNTMYWIAGLLALCTVVATGAEPLKIGTVDLDRVFTAHPKTQAAEADLKTAEESIEADMDQIMADARALEAEVARLREAARNPMLNEEARMKRRAEAEEKITELQEFQVRARRTQETRLKQLRDQVMASRQGIVDELMVVVNRFAEEEGYDLILDRSGLTMNMIPLAVYSSPQLDLTDRLIERMRADAE